MGKQAPEEGTCQTPGVRGNSFVKLVSVQIGVTSRNRRAGPVKEETGVVPLSGIVSLLVRVQEVCECCKEVHGPAAIGEWDLSKRRRMGSPSTPKAGWTPIHTLPN